MMNDASPTRAAANDHRGELRRLAAFTTDPAGGNPAGVWIGDALGAALGRGPGDQAQYCLTTPAGEVGLQVDASPSGPVAALTSVAPSHVAAPPALVRTALTLLDWRDDELDDRLPPAVDMGRPSRLLVTIPEHGGITVAGHAVPIDD